MKLFLFTSVKAGGVDVGMLASLRGNEGLSLIFIFILVKVSRLCYVDCCQELIGGPESASLVVSVEAFLLGMLK